VLAPLAPAQVFSTRAGRTVTIRTALGVFRIRALDDPLPVGALPLGETRRAIRNLLVGYARAAAVEAWTVGRQEAALRRTTCAGDDLPPLGSVDLGTVFTYLALPS
jgi:hypothetical protein